MYVALKKRRTANQHFAGKRLNVVVRALAVLAVGVIVTISFAARSVPDYKRGSLRKNTPQAVYADDPKDAWNRIFYSLFTRTVKTRLAKEFGTSEPFVPVGGMGAPGRFVASTIHNERIESGDRAIDPLYPSFISEVGVSQALSEPLYSVLRRALIDAIDEKASRPALDRALMQSDVWAAYDILFAQERFLAANSELFLKHRAQLLPLLARFVHKLALTPGEINALPDNYTAAAGVHRLPDLFSSNSEWIEVQWRLNRLHDYATDHRRAARVFIKPTSPPADKQKLLDDLRENPNLVAELDAVALVIQNLLIDSRGEVVVSPLMFEVQLRSFDKDRNGSFLKTSIAQYELSRRQFITSPRSGGLVAFDDTSPTYLPEAGNDYSFGSLQRNNQGVGSPVLVTLRSRCVACHGEKVTHVFTLKTHHQPPFPPVTYLNHPNNDRAAYVTKQKIERDDFKALQRQLKAR